MSEFFGRIRSGADKARFEAERLIRVNQAQSVLKDLERQLQAATAAMGTQALALYDAGALMQPELLASCQQIGAIRQRISAQGVEIERIRQEQPPEAPVAARYGHMCPQCQIQLPAGTGFCPQCGSKAVYIAPPPIPTGMICPTCGAHVPAGARFCPVDGTSIEQAAVSAPPSTVVCPSCQGPVPANAVYCPHCGASATEPGLELAEAELIGEERSPEEIYCPDCGSPIPREADFCPECGHRIAATPPPPEADVMVEEAMAGTECPSCGSSIPADAVFCPECGSSIAAPPSESGQEEASPEAGEEFDRIVCPNCQASLPAEAEFCTECGTAIEATVAEVVVEEDAASPGEELGFAEGEDLPGEEPEAAQDLNLAELEETEDLSPEKVEEEEAFSRISCPSCQASVPVEADFCPECGEPLPSVPVEPE